MEKHLQNLKNLFDLAIAKGLFQNSEQVSAVGISLNAIQAELSKPRFATGEEIAENNRKNFPEAFAKK